MSLGEALGRGAGMQLVPVSRDIRPASPLAIRVQRTCLPLEPACCGGDEIVTRQTPASDTNLVPPVGTFDAGDRRAAELRRSGHAPTRHDKLALAVVSNANDRRELIREDRREQRQVARAIMLRAEQVANGGPAFGQAVEVAHSVALGEMSAARQSSTVPRRESSLTGRAGDARCKLAKSAKPYTAYQPRRDCSFAHHRIVFPTKLVDKPVRCRKG